MTRSHIHPSTAESDFEYAYFSMTCQLSLNRLWAMGNKASLLTHSPADEINFVS